MSEKRNIRDHKRRLLAAKYELRRKLYKALCKDPDLTSDMRDKHRSKLSKLPRKSSFARVRNRSSRDPFDGHKEIVLVATTKPREQGLAPQQVYKQVERRSAEVVPIIEVRVWD
ncbi:PREDICTED: uncharacterized protein LOC109231630 [Nicotiana attenuata]|uniref:uncharacterized protein LOC109231630 n=1 Tax=Nicotiana attenuata TaxID=49451 RepID=UPI000904D18A|nr:PREDICTED: uncharacterized protein LOC109231630 [Nicotiana attenuata]